MLYVDIIIHQIIDIDKKADEILTKSDEYIKEEETKTKQNIEKMRNDIIQESRDEAQKLYDSEVDQAKTEAETIVSSSKHMLYEMETKFKEQKDTLEDSILSMIFINQGENHE